MRSRGDRARAERLLRAVAWVALGALVARTFLPPGDRTGPRRVEGALALRRALHEALVPGAHPIVASLDVLPGTGSRALARAVAAAGTPVAWREREGAPLPRMGGVVEPVATPDARVRLTVVGGGSASIAVQDAAGALDSAQLSAAGVRVLDVLVGGAVELSAPRGSARLAAPDSALLRPVLVVGRAGWEGKFVAAALEEGGWVVEARLAVAPGVNVRQGDNAPLDTSRYAAVVALDETVAPLATAVSRFVHSGGGLVLLPDAATVPALRTLLPAAVGEVVSPLPGALQSPEPRRGLGGVALTRIAPRAVVLERDGARSRMVAWRVELGRVLLSGYRESWRWRMEGDDAAPDAHRAWWNGLVASVAYAPLAPRSDSAAAAGHVAADPAPYAALVQALGTPRPEADISGAPTDTWPIDALLLALFTAALLGEWGSRRLRGAR